MRTGLLDGDCGGAEACRRLGVHLEVTTAKNLDALWDVLRTDARGPFEIVWRDHGAAKARLGAEFDRLAALFARLAAERRDVRVTLA